jgi:hypothetical protein
VIQQRHRRMVRGLRVRVAAQARRRKDVHGPERRRFELRCDCHPHPPGRMRVAVLARRRQPLPRPRVAHHHSAVGRPQRPPPAAFHVGVKHQAGWTRRPRGPGEPALELSPDRAVRPWYRRKPHAAAVNEVLGLRKVYVVGTIQAPVAAAEPRHKHGLGYADVGVRRSHLDDIDVQAQTRSTVFRVEFWSATAVAWPSYLRTNEPSSYSCAMVWAGTYIRLLDWSI